MTNKMVMFKEQLERQMEILEYNKIGYDMMTIPFDSSGENSICDAINVFSTGGNCFLISHTRGIYVEFIQGQSETAVEILDKYPDVNLDKIQFRAVNFRDILNRPYMDEMKTIVFDVKISGTQNYPRVEVEVISNFHKDREGYECDKRYIYNKHGIVSIKTHEIKEQIRQYLKKGFSPEKSTALMKYNVRRELMEYKNEKNRVLDYEDRVRI